MPEIVEVEAVRSQLQAKCVAHSITDVSVSQDDPFLFQYQSHFEFVEALKGATLMSVGRRGKYFWFELKNRPCPIFHLGMTGNIALFLTGPPQDEQKIPSWSGLKLWSGKSHIADERLRFCRLSLRFDHGIEMAFLDPRRFGRVWLTENPLAHPRIQSLGLDPLSNTLSYEAFTLLVRGRRAPIKAVLLDQSLIAGIGNWIADEVLFQAEIAPQRKAQTLSPAELDCLHQVIIRVIEEAVSFNADYRLFPAHWLFHHRWGKKRGSQTSLGHVIWFWMWSEVVRLPGFPKYKGEEFLSELITTWD